MIEVYISFCSETCAAGRESVISSYGEHAWDNMSKYKEDWIGGKKEFMLGQFKSWSDEKVYDEFIKLI